MAGPRYSILPADAVFDERLTDLAFRVLAALGAHADNNGWCVVRQKTLAERLHASADAVRHAIGKLVALGYVRVRPRHAENGAQLASWYQVCMDREPPAKAVEDGIEAAEDTEIEQGAAPADIPAPPGSQEPTPPVRRNRPPRLSGTGVNKNDPFLESGRE